MAIAEQILDEVRRIFREVLGGGTVTVYLFGSWARGEATAISDIDLAIEARTPLAPGTLARLRERLEDSRVPYRVEVVDLNEVDPAFRGRILAESVRWSV
ncbi:MAG: nucleotidyltransferase domain-containing protein [Candidatus Rokubacteria bacterium]|nr:nucleotidyltransferase domain-containing protein [Candidatus Rokubacteria bacterium]